MSDSVELARELGLAQAGLAVLGVLAPGDHDARVPPAWRCAALLPEARAVCVVGAGGTALFDAFEPSPEAGRSEDPLDAFVARILGVAIARLEGAGHPSRFVAYHEERAGEVADFVALAEACGVGTPSRLGLLLHPEYGPWLSLRALLLTGRPIPPTPPRADFRPCDACPAPCARACRGGAVGAGAGAAFDVAACAAARRRDPACLEACDARRACVVGPAHAYRTRAEAHHMRASARRLGLPLP